MIEVRNLTKSYGSVVAVRDATFHIDAGEIVGFLGPNGAGKSTTIRMLTGYLPPTTGGASIGGFDVFSQGDAVRERIGYLPENVPLYQDLRVEEFLRFRAAQKKLPRAARSARIADVVEQCGLREMRLRLIGALSRGFRQRVGLADALLASPPVLILDEPTSGFDPLQRVEMLALIRGLSRDGHTTVLFSSHILSEVQAISKRLLVIAKGRIVADGAAEALIQKFGENRFHVEAIGEPEAILGWLGSIPGVESARVSSDPPSAGASRFTLTAKSGADPRDAIYDACVKRGIRLRELASDRTPLETIFARLVSGEETADAGANANHPAGAAA
jgi:ABC-2 type transport system ATP-binding protein